MQRAPRQCFLPVDRGLALLLSGALRAAYDFSVFWDTPVSGAHENGAQFGRSGFACVPPNPFAPHAAGNATGYALRIASSVHGAGSSIASNSFSPATFNASHDYQRSRSTHQTDRTECRLVSVLHEAVCPPIRDSESWTRATQPFRNSRLPAVVRSRGCQCYQGRSLGRCSTRSDMPADPTSSSIRNSACYRLNRQGLGSDRVAVSCNAVELRFRYAP